MTPELYAKIQTKQESFLKTKEALLDIINCQKIELDTLLKIPPEEKVKEFLNSLDPAEIQLSVDIKLKEMILTIQDSFNKEKCIVRKTKLFKSICAFYIEYNKLPFAMQEEITMIFQSMSATLRQIKETVHQKICDEISSLLKVSSLIAEKKNEDNILERIIEQIENSKYNIHNKKRQQQIANEIFRIFKANYLDIMSKTKTQILSEVGEKTARSSRLKINKTKIALAKEESEIMKTTEEITKSIEGVHTQKTLKLELQGEQIQLKEMKQNTTNSKKI